MSEIKVGMLVTIADEPLITIFKEITPDLKATCIVSRNVMNFSTYVTFEIVPFNSKFRRRCKQMFLREFLVVRDSELEQLDNGGDPL